MDRTATSHRARARRHNAALLSGCAIGLALAAMPQAALAQAVPDSAKGFQGSHTVDAGDAEVFAGGAGSQFTQVDVKAAQTVLTWTPDDPATSGTIDFLPNGYSASFTSSTLGDYTVLNRIVPGGAAKIGLDGYITSSVSNGEGQSAGGNVWFYTPNGFVVGPNAVIQVGGLVMTTNDIVFGAANTGGDTLTDANGNVLFRGTTPGSSIVIDRLAEISGNNSNSYVALVSPRIEQGGTVRADRSIAYVAGNQVDLKINAGNFDIVVGEGTTDANGIVHTGTTTGNGSYGFGDVKAMQFVAVPKNTALTMLLSGSIGYTPATSSYYDGGSIVLTAGSEGSPDGNIDIGASNFRNNLTATATGDITVAPPVSNSTEGFNEARFESYATLTGEKSVHVTAAGGAQIVADRGLTIYTGSETAPGSVSILAGPAELIPPDPEDPTAPDQFTAAGYIRVSNGLSVYADHTGQTSADGATGLDAIGGAVTMFADGGTIDADYAYLYARGYGGFGTEQGGDGRGGRIDVHAGLGGAIYAGYLSADAEGHGGASYDYSGEIAVGGRGGIGRGGAVTIADSSGPTTDDPTGGLLGVNQFSLDVSAIGGNSLERASGLGGDAFGGTIDFTIDRQNQNIGSIYGYARAADGDGGSEDPVGGAITMTVGGGTAVTLDTLYLNAGAEASVNSAAGAFGQGGTIDLTVKGGASLDVSGDTNLTSVADVSYYYYDTVADTSPDLTGGTVKLTADGGRFTTNNLNIDVSANNVGATTSAGFAHGGTAIVTAANGGSVSTVANSDSECSECSSGGFFVVRAQGFGTSGLSPNLVTGGDITLSAQSGGSTYSDNGEIYLYAGTNPSNGSASTTEGLGFTVQGGTIAIDAIGGTIQSGIFADASGQGGDADSGGGSGTGGSIAVRVLEGGELQNSLYASASGSGGFTYASGRGGDGTGGRFTLESDATATFTNFGLEFYGNGQGGATNDGVGGDGHGGSAQIDIIGGTHDWSQLYLSGYAFGSTGFSGDSLAGSAYGSPDGLNVHVGGGADLTLGYLGIDARAAAGGFGDGNEAIGGSASLLVDGLATLNADSIGINASGMLAYEERSATGYATTPSARGGSASAIANTGTITTPYLEVIANGQTAAALVSAGTAQGGSATVGSSAGGLIDIVGGVEGTGGLTIEARGLGAEGPIAAHATGGTATLYTAGGQISSVFDVTVNADAAAGDFANSFLFEGAANGFNATGGTASVEMRAGGSGGGQIDAPSLTLSAQGIANSIEPVQGAGGIGTGGTATLNVAQGALNTGAISVNASGLGGIAAQNLDGAAYASGVGAGGSAIFQMSGGSIDTTGIEVSAQGVGGDGANDSEGGSTSLAADGIGGAARFIASGGVLSDSGALSVQATGAGGDGGFNPRLAPGGNGADGFGGTATLTASPGGSATLGIAGEIRVNASGLGGGGGLSYAETAGSGGDATGGSAAMTLADIPFAFGAVLIDGSAVPGAGSPGGSAIGGNAAFALVDTTTAAIGPRTIDSLYLNAASYAGADAAASVGGSVDFTVQVGNAASGLAITNDLSLYAFGATGPSGYGVSGTISGAPVTVGGAVSLVTPRDAILTISGAGALDATGNLTVAADRTFTSAGAISTAGDADIRGGLGITMTDLSVGGSTSLQSLGPVVVSRDLSSVGPVTVSGQSVLLRSFGGLTFADADALGGDLKIETAGDLLLASVDATGAVTLTSNGGSIHNTGAVNGVGIAYTAAGNVISDAELHSGGALSVDAGGTFNAPGTVTALGNVSLSADLGLNLAGVASGGTTLLQADAGDVAVASLTSPGSVTALGQSVTIASPGALSFANAAATAGDLVVTTAGPLAVAQGSADGAITLTSSGGTVQAGVLASGSDLTVSGAGAVILGTATSGGATALTSNTGAVTAQDLRSAGPVTARGTAIDIASSGALNFADLDASAGNVSVVTAGNLAVATVDATGSATLISTGGAINASGAINAVGITLSSLAGLALNGLATSGAISLTSTSGAVTSSEPLVAGGSLTVAGNSGIALGNASSGSATQLTAANGAITVTNLSSVGPVTASGRSLDIGSTGALRFASAAATAGNLTIGTAGNLIVSQANAAGALSLTSTAGSVVSTGTITAGGNAGVSGQAGVALGTLTSGGATALTSAGGAVQVANLSSTGPVTASGRSVTIGSNGALTFADARATAGNLSLTTAGNLGVTQAGASGTLALTSTGGSVSGTGAITAGGNAAVSGSTGVALVTLSSGGTTALNSANGSVSVTGLNSAGAVTASGRSVAIGSSGALAFADLDATAGDIAVQTAGNLTLTTVDATGAASLVSTGGSVAASNAVTAGGALTVAGSTGVSLGTARSGAAASLTSANGDVAVTALTSAGPVTTSGRSVSIASPDALTFANAQATAGNLDLTTAGDLSLAQGSAANTLRLTSTGGAVSGSGPLASGSNAFVSGNAGIALAALTSGGTTTLTSANGAVGVSNLNSAGQVTASGRAVTIGSSGALNFADLDATAGDVAVQAAGDLTVATVDATGSMTLTSTGGALQTGGALNGTGIALSAFANLQLTAPLATAGALSLTSTGGTVSASAPLIAGGNLAVAGATGVSLGTATSGGTTALSSTGGAVVVGNLNSAGPVTASGRAVTIGSSGSLAFADLDATAGNIAVQTAGNLTAGAVDATGSVTLTSTGGALQTNGPINGNGLTLSALASLQLGAGLATAGALNLISTSGSVSATGPVSAGGSVAASGQTGIAFGSLASGGTTSLSAPAGSVTVAALTSASAVSASGRAVDVRGPGSLTVASAQATAGNLTVQAGQNLAVANASASGAASLTAGADLAATGLVNAATIALDGNTVSVGGQVRATANLDVVARQLFTVSGLAAGQTIAVSAGDIAIGQTGRVGSRGLTRSIALRNLALTAPMNIGGTGQQGQFSLDKNEAARLFADEQISFISRSSQGAAGDVRVGDLALSFGGDQANIGAGGLLKVDAGGLVEVNGAVALTTVSAEDAFSIDPQRIDVIAGSGSIVMKNASGALQGVLELSAGTIAVADRTTLDTIGALTDFAAISAALDTPGPAGPDGGYLQAGTINLLSGEGVFIQNGGSSADYADRRGFRANTLNIETESSDPRIAINGVIIGPSGDLTGLDTAQGVTINGVVAADLDHGALVTINGCGVGVNCGIPEYGYGGLSSDELEQLLATADEAGTSPAGQMIQVEETQPLITPPLVDEPITGVGNDDLWQVKCTPEGDKSCPAEEGSE